jgi:hypothetical protein
MARKGVLGVLSITGFPGHYTVKKGLTGPTLVSGDKDVVLEALGEVLVAKEDDKMQVVVWGPNLRDQSKGTFHVHAADCADNRHYGSRGKYGGEDGEMAIEVGSALEVITYVYADQIAEQPQGERMEYIESLHSDFFWAPCVKDLQ